MDEIASRADERLRFYDFSSIADLEQNRPLVERRKKPGIEYFGTMDQITLHSLRKKSNEKYWSVVCKDPWHKEMSARLSISTKELGEILNEDPFKKYIINFELPSRGSPIIVLVTDDDWDEEDDPDDEGEIPPRIPDPCILEPMGVE